MEPGALKDWVTIAVLILGTVGAAWKWIFEEIARKYKDTRKPALEGTISIEQFPHTKGKCLIKVSCFWKNLSLVKIYLDPEKTHITLYDLEENFEVGTVKLKSKNTPFLHQYKPYEGANYIYYEKGSTSEQTASFILSPGRSYGVRAIVQMDEKRMKAKDVFWSRETVFYAQNHE